MADRVNLMDFLTKTLDGMGYGKISKTNRAYSWIRNNHALEGPCLNFLKQSITADNVVTVKEMNLFTELQKEGNLPSESEIDEVLSRYLTDAPVHLQNMHVPALHIEASQASKYCETLELEEKILKQQCQKLQDEIKTLESQQKIDIEREEAIVTSAMKKNTVYNSVSKEIQYKLSKASQISVAPHDNTAVEERTLFRMNLDTFRKINNTFHESVDAAFRRHFKKGKRESIRRSQNTDINEAKNLICVAQSLGQFEYQHLKLQCEENESSDLDDYIENVLKKFNFNGISSARLKSQLDADMESTYQVQKKIMHLAEVLEKFHSDYIVKKMLMAYRKQSELRMKSDCKFMRKISDTCSKFVDLMTLQACLFHEEKENIDTIVAVCDQGRKTLEKHTRKHLMTMTNLKKMFEDRESHQMSNQSSCFSTDSRISNSTLIVPNDISLHVPDDDSPNAVQDKILSFMDNYLSDYFIMREQLNELDEIVFSGPVRQIFFCGDVHTDESLVKQQYDQFSSQYKSWRSQYYKVLDNTNVTSLDQRQKTLGLMFLANPTAVRQHIEQLRNKVHENRSKCSNTLAVGPVNSSTFSQLDVKKGNISSAI